MAHKDREKARAYAREYYHRNRDKMRDYNRQWYAENNRPIYLREWRKKNPGKQVAYNRKSRFGLTPLDIYTLRKMQNNRCAICGEEETRVLNGVAKDLCIDHDHATGKVRALLCGYCNVMIGNARDRIDNLQRAIAYLEGYQKEP